MGTKSFIIKKSYLLSCILEVIVILILLSDLTSEPKKKKKIK